MQGVSDAAKSAYDAAARSPLVRLSASPGRRPPGPPRGLPGRAAFDLAHQAEEASADCARRGVVAPLPAVPPLPTDGIACTWPASQPAEHGRDACAV
jgi:hypothetical protein